MMCFWCKGSRRDHEFPAMPCRYCQGMEPSCCDGPVGEPDEEPTDPEETEHDDD